MFAETSALISSLSTIKDLGSALLNERDRQKAAALQIDLTDKVIQAQAQLSQVLATVIDKDGRIQALSERVRELEAEQSEKARYRLAKLGTEGDFFAYQLRAPAELTERADEPSHFICQPCFDAGKKHVLVHNGDGYWLCNHCKLGHQAVASQFGYDVESGSVLRNYFP